MGASTIRLTRGPGWAVGVDDELRARFEASVAGLPGEPVAGEGGVDAAESASANTYVATERHCRAKRQPATEQNVESAIRLQRCH